MSLHTLTALYSVEHASELVAATIYKQEKEEASNHTDAVCLMESASVELFIVFERVAICFVRSVW